MSPSVIYTYYYYYIFIFIQGHPYRPIGLLTGCPNHTWYITSLHLKVSVRHVYILACGRLADPGGVHFFTLKSCRFNKGPAKSVLHRVQRPSMSQGRRNNVIVQDFYFLCSLEDKLPLSFESVVVCCQFSSPLCYSRLFFLVFCAIFAIVYSAVVYDCHVPSTPVQYSLCAET